MPLLVPPMRHSTSEPAAARVVSKRGRLYRRPAVFLRQPAATPSYTVSPAGQPLKRSRPAVGAAQAVGRHKKAPPLWGRGWVNTETSVALGIADYILGAHGEGPVNDGPRADDAWRAPVRSTGPGTSDYVLTLFGGLLFLAREIRPLPCLARVGRVSNALPGFIALLSARRCFPANPLRPA